MRQAANETGDGQLAAPSARERGCARRSASRGGCTANKCPHQPGQMRSNFSLGEVLSSCGLTHTSSHATVRRFRGQRLGSIGEARPRTRPVGRRVPRHVPARRGPRPRRGRLGCLVHEHEPFRRLAVSSGWSCLMHVLPCARRGTEAAPPHHSGAELGCGAASMPMPC